MSHYGDFILIVFLFNVTFKKLPLLKFYFKIYSILDYNLECSKLYPYVLWNNNFDKLSVSKIIIFNFRTKKVSTCDIRRFSRIDTDRGAPYFELYKPQNDPLGEIEKKPKNGKSKKHRKRKPDKTDKEGKEKKQRKCPIEDAIDKNAKYSALKPRRWVLEDEERHQREKCKYYICPSILVRIPSPVDIVGQDLVKVSSFIIDYVSVS